MPPQKDSEYQRQRARRDQAWDDNQANRARMGMQPYTAAAGTAAQRRMDSVKQEKADYQAAAAKKKANPTGPPPPPRRPAPAPAPTRGQKVASAVKKVTGKVTGKK